MTLSEEIKVTKVIIGYNTERVLPGPSYYCIQIGSLSNISQWTEKVSFSHLKCAYPLEMSFLVMGLEFTGREKPHDCFYC